MEKISTQLEKEQCRETAGILVDALIDAGLISEHDMEKTAEILEEELIVRKSIRRI